MMSYNVCLHNIDYGSMPNRSCGGANTNNNNTTTSENGEKIVVMFPGYVDKVMILFL